MNDPIDEIFNGTPDGIDEDELKQMRAAEEQRASELEQVSQEQEEEESSSPGQPTQQAKPQEEKPKEEAKPTSDKRGVVNESLMAVNAGIVDFGVDLINLTGANIPKISKFDNEVAQSVRDISSIVSPTLATNVLGVGGLQAAGNASKIKLLSDPFVKWLGTTSAGAGFGAAVDSIAEVNERDDNVLGSLKKSFPNTMGWIPDDIATLDSDSPDTKRAKNVYEGVGLGLVTDLISGISKLASNLSGATAASKWIPESEKAQNWLKNNAPDDSVKEITDYSKAKERYVQNKLRTTAENYDALLAKGVEPDFLKPESVRKTYSEQFDDFTPDQKRELYEIYFGAEDVVETSAAKRSDDLDNLGGYNFSKSQNLDEPVFGLHDLYGYEEMGIRSADDLGIVGASIDQVRIAKNIDSTYGRLGSVMTEPAMKFALEGAEEYEAVIKGLRETLVEADEIGYRVKGRTITAKEVQDEGLRFAANLNQMDIDQMRRFLDDNRPDIAGQTLNEVAAKGVRLAIKESMQELKASALIRGSLAGQVSDMAQGARFAEGTATTIRSEEQIIDRLEFLMIQNGKDSYSKGRALSMLNMSKRGDAPTPAQLKKQGADALKRIQAEAKATADVLREIKEVNPEMLNPLLLAYEATDGKVSTIDALNNYFRQSTGVIKKAFVDGQPDIPSVIMQGFWSNVYNSTLSAFATPIKAVASAGALLIERPVATFAGALAHGDGYTLRRGLYQYSAFTDAMQKGMKYFGETMSRSAKDPTYAGVAGRDSLIRKNEQQIEILNAFADAKAAKGEYGPQALMAQVEEIQALADHPWLRFGTRLMQATDGFTQTVVGVAEARGKAFDKVNIGSVKPEDIQAAYEQAYKKIWSKDSRGREIITDKAVKQASGEIAMNLDSKFTDGISGFINRVPALRPFLLFTKTPVNMLQLFGSHNPVGLFADQVNQFSLPFEQMPINKVEELLSSRGIPMDEFAEQNYNAIRAELKGRKAIGSLAVMSAVGLFMNDSLTGNGHYDRQKQRLRRDADWKPRSIKLPGGNWVSYDNLGPFGDWLALTADVMDNSDRLDEGGIAENLSAVGFIISASITDKSMLAGIEPLYDILSGNPAAINRWASSFLPATVMRGSSQMAELTRLISPELRVVEENLFAMMANRTPLKGSLPEQYDWIDGDKVNEPGNFIARVYNTYSPWKVNGKISDEKQFLMDIEYDHRPSMMNDGKGLKLTLNEQADVYRLMGKDGGFKKAIRKIMNSVDGKKFREEYKRAVKNNDVPPRLQDYASIHLMLDRELNLAKETAISTIDRESGGALNQRRFEQEKSRRDYRLQDMLIPTR